MGEALRHSMGSLWHILGTRHLLVIRLLVILLIHMLDIHMLGILDSRPPHVHLRLNLHHTGCSMKLTYQHGVLSLGWHAVYQVARAGREIGSQFGMDGMLAK